MSQRYEVKLVVEVVDEVDLAAAGARVSIGGQLMFLTAREQISIVLHDVLGDYLLPGPEDREKLVSMMGEAQADAHSPASKDGIRIAELTCAPVAD